MLMIYRSSLSVVFYTKVVLKNFAKFAPESLFNQDKFIKRETLAQVFSCEFCEVFKNIYFYRTPLVAASGFTVICLIFRNFRKVLILRGCSYGGGLSRLNGLPRLGGLIFIPCSYENFPSHSTGLESLFYIFPCYVITLKQVFYLKFEK